jgi:hypothetical protein
MIKQLMVFVLLVSIVCFFSQTACGQATDSTTQATDSTQGTDNRSTIGKVALGAFTAVAIPTVLATVLADVFPPAGNLIVEKGTAHLGFSFETGVGFGEREKMGRYPEYRIQLQFSYFPDRLNPTLLHLIYDYDVRLFPVDKRQLFTLGFSPGIGLLSDFHSQGIAAEISIWLMHPSLFYIGFVPQHNVYFRLRYNYAFNPAQGFGEISAGISSTFTFGK